jgi:hypothetical protein
MIRQVSWSEVSARIADAPERAEHRAPARRVNRGNDRSAAAPTRVARLRHAVAVGLPGRPAAALA